MSIYTHFLERQECQSEKTCPQKISNLRREPDIIEFVIQLLRSLVEGIKVDLVLVEYMI